MELPDNNTPARLGYRWPAEWEPHAATWLAWPHNRNTWPGKFDLIPACYARLVHAIAQFEPVRLLVAPGEARAQAQALVGHLANVALIDIPTNDTWVRDHGPMFLVAYEQPRALVDWGYNAWGGKYPPFDLDDAVPARIANRFGWRRFDPHMVLEGGAVDGNGAGTVLTTRSCLLHPSRNPQLDPAEIERRLKAYTGATHVVWLSGGEFAGDDTDGHVDQLARFVNERTVVAASCEQADDEHDELLARLHRELKAATDQAGRSLNVVPLPLPSPKYHDGQRLPASYCNFYITNGGVVAPQFGDKRDAQALDILGGVFPDRTIVGVDAFDLVWGLGAFHCMTQQEPSTDNRSPCSQ